MGRGDIRSKKGKITAGSFGKSRMRKSNTKTTVTATAKPVVAEATEAEKPKKTVKKTVKAKKK